MAQEHLSGAGTSGAMTPEQVVRSFLWYTIDEPSLERAASFLDRKSRESGHFHGNGPPAGSTYEVADAEADGMLANTVVVGATIRPAGQTAGTRMQFVLVQEGVPAEWKIDLATTMRRSFEPPSARVTVATEGAARPAASRVRKAAPPAVDPEARVEVPELVEAFRKGPLADFEAELQKATRTKIVVEVDFESLLNSGRENNQRILDGLGGSVFNSFGYALREAHGKVSFKDRVTVVRLERAMTEPPKNRCIFADGSRLVYRLDPRVDTQVYGVDELERILPAVVAGMPLVLDAKKAGVPGPVSWLGNLGGDVGAHARRYYDEVLPGVADRLSAALKRGVGVEFDHRTIRKAEMLEGLYLWGPARVVGGLALLAKEEPTREAMAQAIERVEFAMALASADKTVKVEGGTLRVVICCEQGEAGSFYDYEIADRVRSKLHLAERPKIREIQQEAEYWQKELETVFGRPVTYSIDFDGFVSHADTNTNLRGLYLLKEHGVDHLYYAVTRVAEANPNFKQQFAARVNELRLVYVAKAEECGIGAEGHALVYRLHVHSGYTGYLTLDDLSEQVPALVAGMAEVTLSQEGEEETPVLTEDEAREEAEALARLESMYEESGDGEGEEGEKEVEEDTDAEEDEDVFHANAVTPGEPSMFAQMQQQILAALPMYASQVEQLVGQRIPLEINWPSLRGDALAIGELLSTGLTPVLGGLAVLGADAAARLLVHQRVTRITLQRTLTPQAHGFSLEGQTLVFSAYLASGVPPTDPQLAALMLRSLLAAPAKPAAVKSTTTAKAKSAGKKGAIKPKAKGPTKAKPASKAKSDGPKTVGKPVRKKK